MSKFTQFLYRNVITLGLALIVVVTAVYAISTHNDSGQQCGCGAVVNRQRTTEIPIRQNTPIQQVPSNPQDNSGTQVQSNVPVQASPPDGSGVNDPCRGCRATPDTACPVVMCPLAQ